MTNFERIKGMSVEELAKMLIIIQYDESRGLYNLYGNGYDWLNDCEYTFEQAVKKQVEILESEVEE